jgi:hypothetical protein
MAPLSSEPICYDVIEVATTQETTMDLPVRFPSETEVILEDVTRFRALSPRERIQTIRGMLADGAFLMSKSPKAAWAKQYSEEQELLAQRNIREFITRHAR